MSRGGSGHIDEFGPKKKELKTRIVIIMKGLFEKAKVYWEDLDIDLTIISLQEILDTYPYSDETDTMN